MDVGLTRSDWIRAGWAALFAAAAVLSTGVTDWKLLLGAAVGAALGLLKNGLLADDNPLKG